MPDSNLDIQTAKHAQAYQGAALRRPQRFAERTTAVYKNGPPRLSPPRAKSTPIAPTAATRPPKTPGSPGSPGAPPSLSRAQIAPSGSLTTTTTTPTDQNAQEHAVSRLSAKKIY